VITDARMKSFSMMVKARSFLGYRYKRGTLRHR
jgi:hypothetical protein